jgi:hypothetical protein
MFTRDNLLQTAAEAEIEYQRLLVLYPPGTFHDGRNKAYELMNKALACAAWMEKQGINEIANVGPFMSIKAERGVKVRIKKGAEIRSTDPKYKGGKIAVKPFQVTVFDVFDGYLDTMSRGTPREPEIVQAKVEWVGTHGYWHWTDANNVELVAA